MDRSGVRQVPEGSGEQGKMEKTGCKVIFGAPTTLAVKGLMMMMMIMMTNLTKHICIHNVTVRGVQTFPLMPELRATASHRKDWKRISAE